MDSNPNEVNEGGNEDGGSANPHPSAGPSEHENGRWEEARSEDIDKGQQDHAQCCNDGQQIYAQYNNEAQQGYAQYNNEGQPVYLGEQQQLEFENQPSSSSEYGTGFSNYYPYYPTIDGRFMSPTQFPRMIYNNYVPFTNQSMLYRPQFQLPNPSYMQPSPGPNYIRVHPVHVEAALRQYLAPQHIPPVTANKTEDNPPQTELQVEDALNYMDKVKHMFGTRSPETYLAFLEIMKDFRNQSITTESLMKRVAKLFNGHKDLILGFGAFLPPNYKIQVLDDETLRLIKEKLGRNQVPPPKLAPLEAPPPTPVQTAPTPPTSVTYQLPYPMSLPAAINYHQMMIPNQAGTSHELLYPHPATVNPPKPPSPEIILLSSPSPETSPPKVPPPTFRYKGPADFSLAINYVNKIKTRFSSQPEKYRQFLDILHAYQKQQTAAGTHPPGTEPPKRITEQQVYERVEKIFGNHPDLLLEFGQFLTYSNNPKPGMQGPKLQVPKAKMQNAINKVAGLANRNMTRTPRPRKRLVFPNPSKPGVIKRPRVRPEEHKPINVSPLILKRLKTGIEVKSNVPVSANGSQSPTNPEIATPLPPATKEAKPKKFVKNIKKFEHFDKVRDHLGSRNLYKNFLITLKQYQDGVFSAKEVAILFNPLFLSAPDLARHIKDFLDLCERGKAPKPPVFKPTDPKEDFVTIEFSNLKRQDATYCAYPKDYMQPKCSGRTKLCWEVLNDEYTSNPSCTRDCTFVPARRRTQYEEYFYQSEEQRFELDVTLESAQMAMAHLEIIKSQIGNMTVKQRDKFVLGENYNASSALPIEKSVKKIYGGVSSDVLKGLRRDPVVTVPIVLKRLRQKCAEWQQNREEFNRWWRDEMERYQFKHLENRTTKLKQSDSRSLRSSALVQEIEVMFKTRAEMNKKGRSVEGAHMTLIFPMDTSIVHNARDLVLYHVIRQAWVDMKDKLIGKKILKQFLPELLGCGYLKVSDDEDDGGGQGIPRWVEMRQPVHSPESEDSRDGVCEGNGNIHKFVVKHQSQDEFYRLLFVGENWYVFLRHYQVLCQRLATISNETDKLIATRNARLKDKSTPTNTCVDFKNLLKLHESERKVDDMYFEFLDIVRYVLDGHLTVSEYEKKVWEMFGIDCSGGFTMDKLVQNLVRRLQTLVGGNNEKCYQLYYQAKRWSGCGGDVASAEDRIWAEIAYYREARKILDQEKLFRVVFFENSGEMTFEMMNDEPPTRQLETDTIKVIPDPLEKGTRRFLNRTRVCRVTSALNFKTFVGNSGAKKYINLYWIGCLERAQETHQMSTEIRYEKMYKWHEDWLLKMTTRKQRSDYEHWFKGTVRFENGLEVDSQQKKKADMKVINLNPLDDPPYRSYKRYTKI